MSEKDIVINEKKLPITFCIIDKREKKFCIDINKKRFDKLFMEDLNKKLQEHWEATKEERIRTHTGRLFEKKRPLIHKESSIQEKREYQRKMVDDLRKRKFDPLEEI